MSIDIERWIQEADRDPRVFVTTPRWVGSLRLQAAAIREIGLIVGYDPIFPDNPYHGQVWNRDGKPTSGQQKQQERALRGISTWYVEIPGVDIAEPGA